MTDTATKKKISSFEYAMNKAIDRHDLNENCEPRTWQEEEALTNKHLMEQLGKMRNATTGDPLLTNKH